MLPLPAFARSLAYCQGASTLAIGTSTSDVVLLGLDRSTLARTSLQIVAQGHYDGVQVRARTEAFGETWVVETWSSHVRNAVG